MSNDQTRATIEAALAKSRSADNFSAAARDVMDERRRQIQREGYDHAHDDAHPCGEIAACAAFYAMPPAAREWTAEGFDNGATFGAALWPEGWTVPKTGDRRRELVKAGALVLAEIERIDRAADLPSTQAKHAFTCICDDCCRARRPNPADGAPKPPGHNPVA